jgi:hypothetical protein
MNAIGVLPAEQMRELWQWYQSQKQLPAQLTKNFPQRRPIDEPSPHRAFIYNTGSEIIPAFACVRVVGTREINNITAIDVEKPTSTDGEFLLNGPYPIAVPSSTEPGVGWAYRHGVVTMLGDEPTEPGASYGPIVGSWEIEEGGDKFVVFGRHDFSDRALVGRFNGGGTISQWGLVNAKLGCGWYTIELGNTRRLRRSIRQRPCLRSMRGCDRRRHGRLRTGAGISNRKSDRDGRIRHGIRSGINDHFIATWFRLRRYKNARRLDYIVRFRLRCVGNTLVSQRAAGSYRSIQRAMGMLPRWHTATRRENANCVRWQSLRGNHL